MTSSNETIQKKPVSLSCFLLLLRVINDISSNNKKYTFLSVWVCKWVRWNLSWWLAVSVIGGPWLMETAAAAAAAGYRHDQCIISIWKGEGAMKGFYCWPTWCIVSYVGPNSQHTRLTFTQMANVKYWNILLHFPRVTFPWFIPYFLRCFIDATAIFIPFWQH